jgi:hypothetical protein
VKHLQAVWARVVAFVVAAWARRRHGEILEALELEASALEDPQDVAPAPAEVLEDEPVTIEHEELEAEAAPAVEPRPARAPAPAEAPVWYFKRAILDRLDEYFFCMRRVRRWDVNGYALMSRIGIAVPSHDRLDDELLAKAREGLGVEAERAAFGGLLQTAAFTDLKRYIVPSFVYFHKQKTPPRVQAAHGEIYQFVAVYDNRADYTGPQECYLAVRPDGSVRLLKQYIECRSEITPRRSRRGAPRRGESFTLTSRHWAVPPFLLNVSSHHKLTPEVWAAAMFVDAYQTARECRSGLVVRARRDGIVAAFGVPVKRSSYFFADRDVTALAADGKRKRIFHSVREHDRVIAPDRMVTVKTHYRGIRHFAWNSYDVGIVLPSLTGILDFPLASEVFEKGQKVPPGMMGPVAVGRFFDRELSK